MTNFNTEISQLVSDYIQEAKMAVKETFIEILNTLQTISFCGTGKNRRSSVQTIFFMGIIVLMLLISLHYFLHLSWARTVLFSVTLTILIPLSIQMSKELWRISSIFLFLIGPWISFFLVEVLNGNYFWEDLNFVQILLNMIWYYAIYTLWYILLGYRGLSCAVSSVFLYIIGVVNHYVLTFRGTIIFPCDVFSIRTALNVSGNFDYTPDRTIITCFFVLCLYWICLSKIPRPAKKPHVSFRFAFCFLAVLSLYLFLFFGTNFLTSVDIYAQQWKTQANGYLLNFTAALRYSDVDKPDGYQINELQEIADGITPLPATAEQNRPENVIVIMNESFSDIGSQFPNLELSEDPLPYFHSLKENTISGTAYASVTGGGTANSEYEFLTGNSLQFLPPHVVAYQLYVKDGMPTMVSQMKQLGYQTVAFHPYEASGWNRPNVYQWLGFDKQMYQEDVSGPYIIRKYISDSSDYKELFRLTDETDGPLFTFNVTMQNHSGYKSAWYHLDRSISVSGAPYSADTSANQYFSLLKASDDAIKELIEHYKNYDEKTMIVFFGDHQPPLSNEFYEALYGKQLDARTTKEVFQQYAVPFFIWANYDIQEQENVITSLNYLGVLALQAGNFPLTAFQTYLKDLSEKVPVINTIGFIEADGSITSVGAEETFPEEIQKAIKNYRYFAYNNLLDQRHRLPNFFSLK